jgi:lysine/arginine/ornithine transport system substrate-binding protein
MLMETTVKKIFVCLTLASAAVGVYAKDWTTIRFGVDATYAPFESKAANGDLVGLDIDLGNEICHRLNTKCVWVESDFDGLIPALNARKFDAVLSSMTITPQRAEQIAFSDTLYNTPTRLVAKRGANLMPTPESLKGKAVGVEQGTIQETYAKQNWAPKGVQVVAYQNQDQAYSDLIAGRLDATLQDEVQADVGFLKTARGAGFQFSGPEIPTGDAAIGLRKDDADLKGKIDGAIAAMVKDGTFQKIEKKYLSVDLRAN